MNTPKWTRYDTRWVLSLFGTAVGAGILFLPIKAGWWFLASCCDDFDYFSNGVFKP